MRLFVITPHARLDILSGAEWYEAQREGLGDEFLTEADGVIALMRNHEEFVTAPYEVFSSFVVRRLFFERFPYRAFFTETDGRRDAIAFLKHGQDEERWRARV